MAAVSFTLPSVVQHIRCPHCKSKLEVHVALTSALEVADPPAVELASRISGASSSASSSGAPVDVGHSGQIEADNSKKRVTFADDKVADPPSVELASPISGASSSGAPMDVGHPGHHSQRLLCVDASHKPTPNMGLVPDALPVSGRRPWSPFTAPKWPPKAKRYMECRDPNGILFGREW